MIRMGGFHIAMIFLGSIGKLMDGTGLEDLLVEGVVCLAWIKILSCKDYYQMLRAHLLVDTAMFGLLL